MAKLFANGRSQAVRLPREFRFEGDEVKISNIIGYWMRGNRSVLERLAAIARSRGMRLVTHNVKEFARIPDLSLEDWHDG